jgi:integral membrane protein (TIGR01906 family)
VTADVAFWPARAPRPGAVTRREIALFATCSAVAALVALAVAWSGDDVYREIAASSGIDRAVFPLEDGATWHVDREGLVRLHDATAAYALGRATQLPEGPAAQGGRRLSLFTANEREHMLDVRRVFIAAQLAALASIAIVALLALRARRRGALARLVRAGAIAAAALVAIFGAFAAVAFDAAFLLFHQVFFPQGNFLFPADSNLLRLYPEAYWYGVTLRIAVSFLALAAIVAGVAHLAVRRGTGR